MNILITGIHGFIGSNIVQALQSHHTLYGLDIISPQALGIVKTYPWNALKDVSPVNTIIHLAGKAHDTKNTSSAQSYFDINLGLTQKIFDYFLQSQAEKFIFFSSVKAVADSLNNEILTEEKSPKPLTPYGKSKLEAEKYILSKLFELRTKKDNRVSNDKKIYILRPCMIHGPGNKGNLNLLYKLVSKGIPWPLGAFDNQRSFTSIDNILFIIQQLLVFDINSGIYNVSDDTPISTNRLIELMSRQIHKNMKILNLNKSLIKNIAKVGDALFLPINSERLQKLTESYVVSNNKIKKALNVTHLPIDAEEGIIKTIQTFVVK